jgi:hypothetical protein
MRVLYLRVQSLVLPATKVERVIFEMWRDVLKTAAFGVTDRYGEGDKRATFRMFVEEKGHCPHCDRRGDGDERTAC